MQHRLIFSALLLLFLAPIAGARADKTDDFINAQLQRQRIPGLSLVVVKDGQTIKSAGYGFANRKLKAPATPETVYKIASVSKQFIATGIMLLVQDGRLSLDDPISKHLDAAPAAWNAITVRHLLTHTSGLVREGPAFDPARLQPDANVVTSAYGLPLRFAPGEKYEYSNLAYFTLAEIIRKVSARSWTDYLDEKVFTPSGMSRTRATHLRELLPNRAQGYSDNGKLIEAGDWVASRPSGAFYSTVLDLAKWDAMLYTDKILHESTRRQMWTPVRLNNGTTSGYGFGWLIDSLNGHRKVHHGGSLPGVRASFARFVDDRLTIIVLMNLDDVDLDSIVDGVAAIYLNNPPEPATTGRVVDLPAAVPYS